ncbi:hypothetical protein PF010_g27646 [Phytophthora fragariae]|nr:hypothetical protein PF003_g10179 [Phytophthora fragariae]KAE8919333.1 hypothetical protein PF009_g30359 [Phytophthora fragariae]KAE9066987.1 hypothetical protein PF010_g27646 [Phytophthora fragariae]KAE9079329.1 hypothetical protein PF006_g27543 [Phytophthora fragariae]KAE9271249.1 hypothetical protein PF001_g28461 [Phytophthora fragariae]
MMTIRQEVDRLQALAKDTEDKLHVEMDLRVKSDVFCVQTSTELHEAQDRIDELRAERLMLLERLTEAEATLESHREVTASLERRLVDTNAEATTARRQLATDREWLKASLVAHTAQLDRLRRQLADQDRGHSGVIPARIQALQDENNSLRRANSVLRRHSAMHELDVDTLVLESAGISADEIDWTLLGLNPPDVIVGSPQSGDESSSPDEPSTETSSTPAVPRSSPPASPSSASSSSKRKRDSSPRSSTEGAAASQLPPSKRLGRASVDLRARAAATAAQRASSSSGDQQASVTPPSPSAAFGSPGGESVEGSDASLIPASSSASPSPPSPAASGPLLAPSDDSTGQSSSPRGGGSPGDEDHLPAVHRQAAVMVVVRRRQIPARTSTLTDLQEGLVTRLSRRTPVGPLRQHRFARSNRRLRRGTSTTCLRTRSSGSYSAQRVKRKVRLPRVGPLPKPPSCLQRRRRGLLHPTHRRPRVRLPLHDKGVLGSK